MIPDWQLALICILMGAVFVGVIGSSVVFLAWNAVKVFLSIMEPKP